MVMPPGDGGPRQRQLETVMDIIRNDPEQRRIVKARHEKAVATLHAQAISGAGFPADMNLRQFQAEYNNRLLRQGSTSLPSSFDVGEAFFHMTKEFAGFLLLPEQDYLVSFADFLDYATSGDAPTSEVSKAYGLPDDVIINVNSLEAPDELLLAAESSSSFGFVSASLVRRGDELAVMMVLGEQRPVGEAERMSRLTRESVILNPDKEYLREGLEKGDWEPLRLPNSDLCRTVALARFNLKERRLDTRHLMFELKDSFEVITDNPRLFRDASDEAAAKRAAKLDAWGSVWEIAKTLVLVPSYLAARVDLIRAENKPTELSKELRASTKARLAMNNALGESRVLFRRISAVRVVHAPTQLTGRVYHAPAFQVPVDGFWRSFADPARQGHDEEGNVVQGKTWVRAHLRHKDKAAPAEPKVVYIKASLSIARERLERFRKSDVGSDKPRQSTMPTTAVAREEVNQSTLVAATDSDDVATLQGAYLYVMRCPAHGRDIYKIGFSDRDPELRARELSSATASPVHFLVVQAWAVSDGRAAERAAHNLLAAHRLNGNREFFQATYSELRAGIEVAAKPWLLD